MANLHFHFTQNIQVAQIQLFAKIVKCMMADQYSEDYSDLIIHWMFPQEAQSVKDLEALCTNHRKDETFLVSTPKYHTLEYVRYGTTQIPNLKTSLYLAKLQEKYNNFKQDKFDTSYVKMVDEMMFAFNGINTDLSFLIMNSADEDGTFTWHRNYSPCFFDRESVSQLRGCICEIAIKEHEKGGKISSQMHDIARSLLMNYLYQCGYLAFWSCLADTATFPGNTPQEQEVLDNLATYLLDNYANIYVYNLSVENNPLSGCEYIKRGSAENTTRIKLYFTKEDIEPVLLRLDLPHEGYSYVHLNIEEGGVNKHVPLSKEVVGREYDHVFDNLAWALVQYDFNAADYVHSPAVEDKRIIKDMRYRTALLKYAPNAFYSWALNGPTSAEGHPSVKFAREALIDLLEMDNFKREEFNDLTAADLLEMSYRELL